MSCAAVAAASLLWLASGPAAAPAPTPAMATAPPSVAGEPLFMDIVGRAGRLKAQVEAFRGASSGVDAGFRQAIGELAALDLQGHKLLAARGTDGDLKCILRGISEDLPVKLAAVDAATDPKARDLALREMAYLLNDNVEVITSPPIPAV